MTSGAATEIRRLEVAPGRFTGWIESFADRHGELAASPAGKAVTFAAPDGALAGRSPVAAALGQLAASSRAALSRLADFFNTPVEASPT